jgi:hypothetical protein
MKFSAEYFENEYARFCIQNNILFFEYKPNVVIDLTAAHRIVADRIHMQNERAYPILCDIRVVVDFDKAARDYLAQSGSVLTKAVGLVVRQNVSLHMTSFYLKICKPRVSTKLFTDTHTALAFLEGYK